MTKYDKIYIPTKNIDSRYSLAENHGTSIISKLDAQENVIVCTIEELQEVYRAGFDHAMNIKYPTFKEYMKEKGINY